MYSKKPDAEMGKPSKYLDRDTKFPSHLGLALTMYLSLCVIDYNKIANPSFFPIANSFI